MSDLAARGAFAGLLHPVNQSAGPALSITTRDGLALAALTIRKGMRAEAAARLARRHDGLALVPGPRATTAGPLTLIGTGPESFLAVMAGGDGDFVDEMAGLLEGVASVVDQSDGYGVLRLRGPGAVATLAKAIAIDLHPTAFGPGAAAVTNAGHINVILWQVDETPSFDLAVFRSFAGSLAHLLIESGAAGGIAIG